MTPQEAAKPPTSGVAGALSGTITVSYRYGRDQDIPHDALIRGGVFIPLVGRELRPIGTLSLFWRQNDHEPDSHQIEQAESLAESSMPAIENARRYGEARKLAETDALTGLYNQRYFHETLRREVQRAQRYERNLALIVFDLDDFKTINDQIGHLAGDRVLSQASERLREAVRSVDVACRIGGDEFAVILPESSAVDADQLYRRVHNAMRGTSLGPEGHRLRVPPASPSSSTGTRPRASSSEPTARSTARRTSARTASTSSAAAEAQPLARRPRSSSPGAGRRASASASARTSRPRARA